MADITFDPQIVQQQRDTIQSKQTEIDNLMEQAKQQLSRTSSWTGTAADQYRQTFNTMMNKMDSAKSVIQSYLTFIDNAITEYANSESQNQQDVASYDGAD